MSEDLHRERYRRLQRPEVPRPHPPSSAANALVQVFTETSLPTQPGLFYACHPATILGLETEGGSATITPSTDVMYVDVVGSGTPNAGDLLLASSVGYRWVARKGHVAPAVTRGRICVQVRACEIAPNSSIGATIELFTRTGGVDTTLGSLVTDKNFPNQFCFDLSPVVNSLGFKLSHPDYPSQVVNPQSYTFLNAVQVLTFTGNPTAGTFVLSFPIDGHTHTTAPIAMNANIGAVVAGNLRNALNATLGTGNTTVTTGFTNQLQITFQGLYAGRPLDLPTINPALNQGSISVATSQIGGAWLNTVPVPFNQPPPIQLNLGNPVGYTCFCTPPQNLGDFCRSAYNYAPSNTGGGYARPLTVLLNDGVGDVSLSFGKPEFPGGWSGCAMRTAQGGYTGTITDGLGRLFVDLATGPGPVDVPVWYFASCYGLSYVIPLVANTTLPIVLGGAIPVVVYGGSPIGGYDCTLPLTSPLWNGSTNVATQFHEIVGQRICHPLSQVFTSPALDPAGPFHNSYVGYRSVWGEDELTWTLNAP